MLLYSRWRPWSSSPRWDTARPASGKPLLWQTADGRWRPDPPWPRSYAPLGGALWSSDTPRPALCAASEHRQRMLLRHIKHAVSKHIKIMLTYQKDTCCKKELKINAVMLQKDFCCIWANKNISMVNIDIMLHLSINKEWCYNMVRPMLHLSINKNCCYNVFGPMLHLDIYKICCYDVFSPYAASEHRQLCCYNINILCCLWANTMNAAIRYWNLCN